MNGYGEVPTREKNVGVVDKLCLVESMAEAYAHDREFAEFVLRTIAGSGNGADAQAASWSSFIESLPYRREMGEVLRNPVQVAVLKTGGDCDDLVLALLAGLKSLAIPCQAEILSTSDGWGFHIRARVGLPPLNPKAWVVVDPVWRSEREWAMADRDPIAGNKLVQLSQFVQPNLTGTSSTSSSSSVPWALIVVAGVAYITRRLKWWT